MSPTDPCPAEDLTAIDLFGPPPKASDQRVDDIVAQLQSIRVAIERLLVSVESLGESDTDHEGRLRRLERWQQRLQPMLGLAAFVLGSVATAVLDVWL